MGGCHILDYVLMVDDGHLSEFTAYSGGVLSPSTFSVDVTGLVYTLSYRFKVISRNYIGRVESNTVSSIIADTPQTPTKAPVSDILTTTTTSLSVVLD